MLASVFFLDSANHDHLLPQYQRVTPPRPTRIFTVLQDKVEPPRGVYTPDPDYSDHARKAKYQGGVQLSIVIDPNGEVAWIQLAKSAGMGLDEQAIEKIKTWKFKPAQSRTGEPVAVRVNVEVTFNLY